MKKQYIHIGQMRYPIVTAGGISRSPTLERARILRAFGMTGYAYPSRVKDLVYVRLRGVGFVMNHAIAYLASIQHGGATMHRMSWILPQEATSRKEARK